MGERRRNPRRVVKDVKRRCYQYGSAIVATWVSILSCGHEVEGYPDTRDGRKACPECGSGTKRCAWTYDETHFAWDTECGEKWILEDGGPNENSIRFCHGCGKPVEVEMEVCNA